MGRRLENKEWRRRAVITAVVEVVSGEKRGNIKLSAPGGTQVSLAVSIKEQE